MRSRLQLDPHALLDGRVESARLELKATGSDACINSAIKTICAFANDLHNLHGGYVVFGVEEDKGRALLPPRGLDPAELDSLQKRLSGKIKGIEPEYAPLIEVDEVEGGQILVVRCPAGEVPPYRAPNDDKGKVAFVRIGSETRKAEGDLLVQLTESAGRTPFDHQPCWEARVEDIESALVAEHLHKAGSGLLSEPPDTQQERLQLRFGTNGGSVPRNIALLFFNLQPSRWFRGARVEVARFPDGTGGDRIDEAVFEGPLPILVSAVLQHLKNNLQHRILKQPERAEALLLHDWPLAAIEEGLVNAVIHRSYAPAHPDPIKVDIRADRITITSYPGPMPGLRVEDLAPGRVRLGRARNRRIAELLKDIRLAEARGSGIGKIFRAMAQNGNPPPSFDIEEGPDGFFSLHLPVHPAFLAPSPAAQPLRLGRAAPADEVLGRAELVAQLWRALEHQDVVLVAPPGRGLSSLLGATAAACPPDRVALSFELRNLTQNVPGERTSLSSELDKNKVPA
jgi:ATP-dependent DNA helicase RecG